MSELQRQQYLSALGLDTYMPRWHLPFAPASVLCELPVAIESPSNVVPSAIKQNIAISVERQLPSKPVNPAPVHHLISDMLDTKTALPEVKISKAGDILAQFDVKPVTIAPFSLSIWRPSVGMMVIDSRDTKLALPTELLLNNILRSLVKNQAITLQEDVLRWPMIENSFAKRTLQDARNELQTWLSVQNEIRPVNYLWLMGKNAAMYFLPDSVEHKDLLYKTTSLMDSSIVALLLPCLNELLQNPQLKKSVFAAVQHYYPISQ